MTAEIDVASTPRAPASPDGGGERLTPGRWSGRLRRRRPTRSGIEPPPRSAVDATEVALDTAVWVLVVAWTSLQAVQAVGGGDDHWTLGFALAGLVSMVAVVLRPALWPVLPLIVLGAATAVSLAAAGQSPPTQDAPWFLWQEVLFALAGFALPARRATTVVAVATCAAVAALIAAGFPVAAVISLQALLLAMALISITVRRALVATATAADQAADASRPAELEAATRRARHAEMLRMQRTLHDTVLNTLSGLRLPGRRDPQQVRARAGADLAVVSALSAGVDTSPEADRAIRMPRNAAAPPEPQASAFSASGVIREPGFLAAVLALLTAFGLAILTEDPRRGSWWVAFAVLGALMATVVVVVALDRSLLGALGCALALLAPAPIVLAGWRGTGCDVATYPLWPIAGSVMVVWLLTLAGLPARWIAVATLASVVAVTDVAWQASPGVPCTGRGALVTAFLLSGVGVGLLLRAALARLSGRATAARQQAALIEQRSAVLAAMDDVRESYVRTALRDVVPLLEGLADGSLDPADPAVRARADLAERGVRRLLSLGETHSAPGQVCARVAVAAVAAGHHVTVQEFPPVPSLSQDDVERAVSLLDHALGAFDPGVTVTLTALGEPDGGGGVTMVVNSSARGLRAASTRVGGLRVSQAVFDDETMVEVAWGP